MIEMLGVLAIIGVLSAGGIMGYTVAMENYKVNQTIDDINTVTANAMALFQNSKHNQAFSIVFTPQLCQIGAATEPYCQEKSRWNTLAYFRLETGSSCLGGTIKGSEPCMYVQFAAYDLSKSVCVKLMTHDWSGIAPAYGFVALEPTNLNGGSYVQKAFVKQNQPPLSVAAAETACANHMRVEAKIYFKGTPSP